MAQAVTTKFNLPKTTTFMILPLAFTGKDKRFAGLTNAYQFLLDEIYTHNKAYKAPAKLTYDHFVEKFGMSRETVSKGLQELIRRKIIERVGTSRYRFLLRFNEDDFILIDDYLHKKQWDVGGVLKRLARSRIKTLAFLQRMNDNPKTNGVFRSSQARIGVAINLPRSTAGESVRELVALGAVHTASAGGLHCLTLYTVDAEFKRVKHRKQEPTAAELEAVQALFKPQRPSKRAGSEPKAFAELTHSSEYAERKADELRQRFMRDKAFADMVEKLERLKREHIAACVSRDAASQEAAERELETVGAQLRAYLKTHRAAGSFPQGYFYIF